MNLEEKLSSLQLYIKSVERLPPEAQRCGISLYEFKTILELVFEILEISSAEKKTNQYTDKDNDQAD